MFTPSHPRILAFVFANDAGAGLAALGDKSSLAEAGIGGRNLLVDFVLSNLVNSGIHSIYLLTGKQSIGLARHVCRTWTAGSLRPDAFVSVMPQQFVGGSTACELLAPHANLIREYSPDAVALFDSNQVFRMDVRPMMARHFSSGAHATVATIPAPKTGASGLSVHRDSAGLIAHFSVGDGVSSGQSNGEPALAASMGNYLFDPDVLLSVLRAFRGTDADFARDILPRLATTHRLAAYDFTENKVPGLTTHEDPSYWRRCTDIGAYFRVNLDTVGARCLFRTANEHWPIRAQPGFGRSAQIDKTIATRSVIEEDCILNSATISDSILRAGVNVEENVSLKRSILMNDVVIGANSFITDSIISGNNKVPAGTRIGPDFDDHQHRFQKSDEGITIVPYGYFS